MKNTTKLFSLLALTISWQLGASPSLLAAEMSAAAPVAPAEDSTSSQINSTPIAPIEADYGEMYVIQNREKKTESWQTSLGYSYGFSNPYIGVHGLELNLMHKVNSFISLGVSPNYFFTTQNSVSQNLSNQLGAQNIQTSVDAPRYSGYGTIAVTPLAGMLNWFGKSSVNFDLVATLGLGAARYTLENTYIPSMRVGLAPEVMVTKGLGFSAGIEGTFETFPGAGTQNRVATTFNVLGRF